MELRGGNFTHSHRLLRTLVQARPRRHAARPAGAAPRRPPRRRPPAPGMNTAVRVALRVGMDRGPPAARPSATASAGLLAGAVEELDWMSVSGWVSRPGAELGTQRLRARTGAAAAHSPRSWPPTASTGCWSSAAGPATGARAHRRSGDTRAGASRSCACPPRSTTTCPASDMSIGADTALNSIMTDVDKIKDSAVGARTCFVVEVMGGDCGFLALMSGAGDRRRGRLPPRGGHLPEPPAGRPRRAADGLLARQASRSASSAASDADGVYTTSFVESLFARESGGLFDVRGVDPRPGPAGRAPPRRSTASRPPG